MRYVGGKARLAVAIRDTILAATTDRHTYVEPFVGGGSTFERLAPHFDTAVAYDLSPDVIAMWQGVTSGEFMPPMDVSEEEYQRLRNEPPSALRGFVGFAGSFGGKFFGGYARGKTAKGEPRNYVAEGARAVNRIASAVAQTDTTFIHASYDEWVPVPGAVVYCDPPYADTQGYSTGGFDSAQFWRVMDEWVAAGAHVFVSEYTAPDHWGVLLERKHRQNLALSSDRTATVERLFTRGG